MPRVNGSVAGGVRSRRSCHRLSGTKIGMDDIIAFFDAMGSLMGGAHASVVKLVSGVTEQYVVECQHIRTNLTGAPNLDQQLCVLWHVEDGKIVAGQRLAADQDALDAFFNAVL